jgi:hypothetical protein
MGVWTFAGTAFSALGRGECPHGNGLGSELTWNLARYSCLPRLLWRLRFDHGDIFLYLVELLFRHRLDGCRRLAMQSRPWVLGGFGLDGRAGQMGTRSSGS